MKRLFLLLACGLAVAAQAQFRTTVTILGSNIPVVLNNDGTAELCDEEYRIDDHKYGFYNKCRKFRYDQSVLTIPETINANGEAYTVTKIGRAAFAGYQNLHTVNIPSTVTEIGDYAFFNTSLTRVTIPESVVVIGNRVFGLCPKLRSLRLPYANMAVGDALYDGKKVALTYLNSGAPVNGGYTSPTPVRRAEKPVSFASSSDVDTDIPTTKQSNEETFAIIIANENYKNEMTVPCALHDGQTFATYCQKTLGLPEENIRLLTNATLNEMRTNVNWVEEVSDAYGGDARFIIYYAGHGLPSETTSAPYLLPVDGVGNNPSTAYPLSELYKTLGRLNAKSVTLFLDACFSGSLRGEGTLAAARGIARAYKDETPLGNMVVFSAAQGDETAYPYAEKGHGFFTYFLLKKLQETKGNVSYGELGDYITREVTRKTVVTRNVKKQTPTVAASPSFQGNWKTQKLR